jgi:predicted PolB exonuclease-like 3'-5' exonuclease
MGLDTSYDNISEVLSLLQRYKQKLIVHNGDNYKMEVRLAYRSNQTTGI